MVARLFGRPSAGRPEAAASGWLRLPDASGTDVSVKPLVYLPIYEELLAPLRSTEFSMLELGVWKGDSLTMWRDAFPGATIVGVDLNPPQLDLGPRVRVITGDQSDAGLLARVRAEHAPEGFALIIDDASHIGEVSARSLQALYREHLRPGGLYVIEDWGAGYLASWDDGGPLSADVGVDGLDEAVDGDGKGVRRLSSHNVGMVGLVKRLVDHTAAGTLSMHQPDRVHETLAIEWMRVQDGLVTLKKPGTLVTRRA